MGNKGTRAKALSKITITALHRIHVLGRSLVQYWGRRTQNVINNFNQISSFALRMSRFAANAQCDVLCLHAHFAASNKNNLKSARSFALSSRIFVQHKTRLSRTMLALFV